MKKRLIPAILILSLLSFPAVAGQGDDFGIWTAINLKGGITDKLKAQLWFEMRTKDSTSAIDNLNILPSLSYSVLPFLELGFGAEFVDSQVRKDIGFRPYVKLHLSSESLSFSLREMPFIEIYDDGTPTSYSLRSSVKTAWTIPSTRITPYINIEVFTKRHWDKTRHYAGIDFGFGKRSSLDLFYMYYTFADKSWQRHLLGLTYNIKVF